jgi:protein Tex
LTGKLTNPLDRTAVHPEAYPVVERILARIGKNIDEVMGQTPVIKALSAADFADERFGVPTVKDIFSELEKPGRDPRPEFKMAAFQDGVEKLTDLQPDMVLEGVVTNVAAFGAFVDIGVHQDGLVHVSALANRFVKDPHEVVKPGQIVKVKVLSVDAQRQRIALTMRLDDAPGTNPNREKRERQTKGTEPTRKPSGRRQETRDKHKNRESNPPGAMALALEKLKKE